MNEIVVRVQAEKYVAIYTYVYIRIYISLHLYIERKRL